ncbi:MAG: glycosyltransferase [Desulfovermiculus sp.]
MKLIYHHRTLGDGAEGIHIKEMVQAWRELGCTVFVAGPAGEPAFDCPQKTQKSGGWSRIKRFLPKFGFELLEISYSFFNFFNLSFLILRHKPDFIYDRYMLFNAGPVLAGKAFGLPVVLEVNAPLALERQTQPEDSLTLKKTAQAMERWIASKSSKAVVVSTPLKDYYQKLGLSEGQFLVLPNGANPQRFVPQGKDQALLDACGISREHVVVGFSGIPRQWHGLDFFSQALEQLALEEKNIFVLIVGDGPARNDLEARLQKSPLAGSYCITGRVGPDQIPGYVGLFDVAVCPGTTFYASPMKLVEYMALARAVLAPKTPNILDMVSDGREGLLFTDKSANDFQEKLKALLEDHQLRQELGQQARTRVLEDLNWQNNARKILDLVREIRAESI